MLDGLFVCLHIVCYFFVVPIVVMHAIFLSDGLVVYNSIFPVVHIVVMHAMCLSRLWFYLRNIDTDKQRQLRAFACAYCALSAFL